jgi:hypothetical protein
LGNPTVAESNRAKVEEAMGALQEVLNYAITSRRAGVVGVKLTCQPGRLGKIYKLIEVDSGNGTG